MLILFRDWLHAHFRQLAAGEPIDVGSGILLACIVFLMIGGFDLFWRVVFQVTHDVLFRRSERARQFIQGPWRGRVVAQGLALLCTWIAVYWLFDRPLFKSRNDAIGWVGSLTFWIGFLSLFMPFYLGKKMEAEDAVYKPGMPTHEFDHAVSIEHARSKEEEEALIQAADLLRRPKPKPTLPELAGELPGWFWLLTVVGGALSLAGLAQHWFHFGLYGVVEELIAFYQGMSRAFVNCLSWPFRWMWPFEWPVPETYKDLFVLSLLISAAHWRAVERSEQVEVVSRFYFYEKRKEDQTRLSILGERAMKTAISIVTSVVLLGLLTLATSLYRVANEASGGPRGYLTYRQIYIASYMVYSVACMCLMAVAFFAVSKYLEATFPHG